MRVLRQINRRLMGKAGVGHQRDIGEAEFLADKITALGDGGLVAILFPEQPLVHLGAFKRVTRYQIAAYRQMQDDGLGLGQHIVVGEAHHRHLAGGVYRKEFRRACLLGQHADLDPVKGQAKAGGNEFHLQAIA